jgi:predicted Zn-dependent protease
MNTNTLRNRLALVIALAFVVTSNGCGTDYVTGKTTFNLVSESQEIAMGKEADPAIVAQYGLYKNDDLAAFVSNIGQRTVKVSHRPQLQYTFRVLDSRVINAFALPGGYVYITRGILAHFNSEDELAGVVGHEIGHITARHGAEQMSRAQLAGLGLGLGSILSETFAKYADVAGTGVGLLFLNFSRDQESESDRLGVEYSTRLGYDSHRMAGFFTTLKRKSGQSGQSLPGFLSTHPDPGQREVKVHQLTDQWRGQVAYQPLDKDPDAYLRRIDGIVYGDDPRQGFVENNTFYHPELRFQFPVPAGWTVVNSAAAVQMMSSDKKAAILFRLGKTASPNQEADAFIADNQASVRRRESRNLHGFSATVVESRLSGQDGELGVLSYFIAKGNSVFVFHGFSAAASYGSYAATLAAVPEGFQEARDSNVLNRQPRRLRVKKAPQSGTLQAVLRSLGVAEPELADLAILNGRELGDRVQAGALIKTVGQ